MRFVILLLLLGLSVTFVESAESFCYEEAGNRYGISPHLLHAISKGESNLNPIAVNHNTNGSYDFGLMQINSSWEPTLRQIGIHLDSLADPCTNVMVGAWVLSHVHPRLWLQLACDRLLYPVGSGEPTRIPMDSINQKLQRHLLHQNKLKLQRRINLNEADFLKDSRLDGVFSARFQLLHERGRYTIGSVKEFYISSVVPVMVKKRSTN